ncbi:MAG TPA: hypothetical protein VNO33_20305 [Kofleriaceae bacterium]|nr:hypothetical protein [Kofleriaceae bacterium]
MSRTTFRDRLLASAHHAVARLASELREDGSYGPRHQDLASYYKSPALFLAAGRWDLADRVLGFIAQRFLREDGDFQTPEAGKTDDPELAARPGYPNGWIAVAAQRLGRFEVSEPAWSHFKRYFHPGLGGGCVEGPHEPGAARRIDMLMTAHLGLSALFFGDGEVAHRAEQVLVRFLDQQPEPAARMLLRMDESGALVQELAGEQTRDHQVRADASDQAWPSIGHAIGFLALLHRITGSGEALRAARGYLDFALACPVLPGEPRAHQVAWAAALLGEISQAPPYFDLSVAIARVLMAGQGSGGLWRDADGDVAPHTSFDQTAETALCLLEIARVEAIASRPERASAEVSSSAWRRGVGAWSLRHRTTGTQGDA